MAGAFLAATFFAAVFVVEPAFAVAPVFVLELAVALVAFVAFLAARLRVVGPLARFSASSS